MSMGKSPNWSLVHFHELPLKKGDLSTICEDRVALFALTSYAVTELNVFARLMISVMHEVERDDAINMATFIQQSCVLRIWTLKLFEFHDCLEKLSRGVGTSDSKVIELAKKAITSFDSEPKLHSSFKLARNVRNETAGHYSFKAAKKNLSHVGNSGIASLFVNQKSGNSFYPFGEEVMFIGRLNRHGASLSDVSDKLKTTDKIFAWTKAANSWARQVHLEVFQILIAPSLGGKFKKRSVYWVKPKKVGEKGTFASLYLQTEI